jgi:putative two-component system response regulator
MRTHPIVGEQICSPLKAFRFVLPIIRHHHEKLDGSGYPDGLRGDSIPLGARILQIVDVFDALTTKRPYKPALSMREALDLMELEVGKGWWDGNIFSEFGNLLQSDDISTQKRLQCVVEEPRTIQDGPGINVDRNDGKKV